MCQGKAYIHYSVLFFHRPSEVALAIFTCEKTESQLSLNNLPSKYMVELRFKPNWIDITRIKLHPCCRSLQKRGEKNGLKNFLSIHNRKTWKKCNVVTC